MSLRPFDYSVINYFREAGAYKLREYEVLFFFVIPCFCQPVNRIAIFSDVN